MRKKQKTKDTVQLMGIPYRCLMCGRFQIMFDGTGEPGNCDQRECGMDQVEACGPRQAIRFIVEDM